MTGGSRTRGLDARQRQQQGYGNQAGKGQNLPGGAGPAGGGDVTAIQGVANRALSMSNMERSKGGRKMCSGNTIIKAEHRWVLVWDLIGVVALAYTALFAPYQVGFFVKADPEFLQFWVDRIVDIIFILDLIVNMFRPYEDHNGELIEYIPSIVRNYLSFWFYIDLVSCAPYDLIDWYYTTDGGTYTVTESVAMVAAGTSTSSQAVLDILRYIRLLRLLKLLRLVRLTRIFARFEKNVAMPYYQRALIQLCITIAVVAHWMSCAWALVHFMQRDNEPYTWLDQLADGKGDMRSYENDSDIYLASLHFSIMTLTTVGYGDVLPLTNTEYLVVVIYMTVGGVIWAYVIGSLTGIMSSMGGHDANFKQVMDELNFMMVDLHLTDDVKIRVRNYWRRTQHVYRLNTYVGLMDPLSEALKGEIWLSFIRASGTGFSMLYYFNGASKDFLVEMARSATNRCFAPKEVLEPTTGSDANMFIVRNDGYVGVRGHLYSMGQYWGEDFILETAHLRNNIRAIAISYVEVVTIGRETVYSLLEEYPSEAADVRRAVVRLSIIRAVIRECKMQKSLKFSLTQPSRYSLRIKRCHAEDLPASVSVTGDKCDPLCMFSINGESTSTRPVMEGGATVEWKGDILDFPSLTHDEMQMDMQVTVRDWSKCKCGVLHRGEHTHPKCLCHETLGVSNVNLQLALSHQRTTVPIHTQLKPLIQRRRSVAKNASALTGEGGLVSFELYCQKLVDADLEIYKKELHARGGKSLKEAIEQHGSSAVQILQSDKWQPGDDEAAKDVTSVSNQQITDLFEAHAAATDMRITEMEQRLDAKVDNAQLALDAIMAKLGAKVPQAKLKRAKSIANNGPNNGSNNGSAQVSQRRGPNRGPSRHEPHHTSDMPVDVMSSDNIIAHGQQGQRYQQGQFNSSINSSINSGSIRSAPEFLSEFRPATPQLAPPPQAMLRSTIAQRKAQAQRDLEAQGRGNASAGRENGYQYGRPTKM